MSSTRRRCHYEVLGVERTASDAEIKIAYRRLALEWHPDKNRHRETEATAVFQEITAAYQVLSDPKERAWYDGHRRSILRGAGDDEDGDEDDEFIVNVWSYFSASAYKGYGDESNAFYGVYRRVFTEVHDMERREGNAEDLEVAPSFGDSRMGWEEVEAFYTYWTNFVSTLPFDWADEFHEFRYHARSDRRAMEKINKKARETAKRKYSETIRALAEFVKKRDPRVQAHEEELKRAAAKAAEIEAEAAARRSERFKREKQTWLEQQRKAWEEEEEQRNQQEGSGERVAYRLADESDESSEEEDGRYRRKGAKGKGQGKKKAGKPKVVISCEVCSKDFKSEKQLANHKQSKAHRKMVESLKAEFGDELLEALATVEDSAQEENEDKGPDLGSVEVEDSKPPPKDGKAFMSTGGPTSATSGELGVVDQAGANRVDQEEEEEGSCSSEEEDFESMVRLSKGFNHALQLSDSSSDEEDDPGD